jgi:hypothetical protein
MLVFGPSFFVIVSYHWFLTEAKRNEMFTWYPPGLLNYGIFSSRSLDALAMLLIGLFLAIPVWRTYRYAKRTVTAVAGLVGLWTLYVFNAVFSHLF